MLLKKNTSKCLVICCVVLILLGVAEAGRNQKTQEKKKRCPKPKNGIILLKEGQKKKTTADNNRGDINNRSLAPWTWRSDYNETRIPDTIWEAVCTSRYCTNTTGHLDENYNSRAIKQEILVLKLHSAKQNCPPVYQVVKQTVSIGCTCVHPHVVEQGSTP
uniref:Interleukin 17a/f2 n=1 Tax=Lepisosteus oculatus TaxID=7918 RepID=W5NG92_LEPOC|nr:PREDICTED: interleukin-17A-like [Lepisosteus oculatus]